MRYSEDKIEKISGRSYPLTPDGEYLNPNQTDVHKIFDNAGRSRFYKEDTYRMRNEIDSASFLTQEVKNNLGNEEETYF